MGMHVFVVKLGVEFGRDPHVQFVAGGEDMGEFDALGSFVFLSLLRQTFHANHLCLWVFVGPHADEDVMLDVWCDYVFEGS